MIQVGGSLDSRIQAIVMHQCIYLVSKVMKGGQIVTREEKSHWMNVKNVYIFEFFKCDRNRAAIPDVTDPSHWYRDEIDGKNGQGLILMDAYPHSGARVKACKQPEAQTT